MGDLGYEGSVAGVCVLGCRSGSPTLLRRGKAAAATYRARGARDVVVACGGKAWSDVVEADDLARILEDEGVAPSHIVRERVSLDTHENALGAKGVLDDLGIGDVVLVTCDWHLPRARMLFERAGLRVIDEVGVPPPHPTLLRRVYWRARERVSLWKDLHR